MPWPPLDVPPPADGTPACSHGRNRLHSRVSGGRPPRGEIGTLFGLAVGAIIGGGFATQCPNEPMAAEAGITIQVDGVTPEVAGTLRGDTPLRVDRFVDGQCVATDQTGGTHGAARAAHDFGETVTDPARQG